MAKQSEIEQTEPQLTGKQMGIIGGVIAAIILIILIVANTQEPPSLVDTPQGKLETSTASVIQSTLNVYYVDKGYYPTSYEALMDYKPENHDKLKEYRNELKDFEYSRRGDEQAYQITYTNIDKMKIKLTTNYKEDYN